MKISKYSLLFVFMLSFGFMQAQDRVVKTSPLSLLFGNFNAKYEQKLTDKTSFLVGANYLYKFLGQDVSTFGLDGEYRFFVTNKKKDVPEGFYAGPSLSFNYGSYNFEDIIGGGEEGSGNYSTLGVGVTLGYQWIFESGVALDLGAGPQYNVGLSNSGDDGFDVSGVSPRILLAVGYAF